jgi:hypothetical protein
MKNYTPFVGLRGLHLQQFPDYRDYSGEAWMPSWHLVTWEVFINLIKAFIEIIGVWNNEAICGVEILPLLLI